MCSEMGAKCLYFDRVTGDPEDRGQRHHACFWCAETRTLTQHWVEVPISFKFRTRQIGHITYWGQFGLGLGLNLRSTADDEVDYLYRAVATVRGGRGWSGSIA